MVDNRPSACVYIRHHELPAGGGRFNVSDFVVVAHGEETRRRRLTCEQLRRPWVVSLPSERNRPRFFCGKDPGKGEPGFFYWIAAGRSVDDNVWVETAKLVMERVPFLDRVAVITASAN